MDRYRYIDIYTCISRPSWAFLLFPNPPIRSLQGARLGSLLDSNSLLVICFTHVRVYMLMLLSQFILLFLLLLKKILLYGCISLFIHYQIFDLQIFFPFHGCLHFLKSVLWIQHEVLNFSLTPIYFFVYYLYKIFNQSV